VSRQDVAKGYEYAKDQYLVVSREALAELVPSTANEISISEFVQTAETDLTHFASTFYVVPNRSDEAYALLFQALARTGLAGMAQITIFNNRESAVILRASGWRIIAQTLFSHAEIRREREYRADTSAVSTKKLDLALQLIEDLRVPFEPLKYFDRCRDGLQRLVRTRVAAQIPIAACNDEPAGATPLLEALQRSLKRTAGNSPAVESRLVNSRR
jgi:DNA end-binding protein Ku